jgi:hypothetical protein
MQEARSLQQGSRFDSQRYRSGEDTAYSSVGREGPRFPARQIYRRSHRWAISISPGDWPEL